MSQSRERAYLYDLPRCTCGRPATVELRNGVNGRVGVFCGACGKRELVKFRRDR